MEIINGVNIDVVIGDCSTDLFDFLKTTHLRAEKFRHTAEICDKEKSNHYVKVEEGVTVVRTNEGLYRTKPFVFINTDWTVEAGMSEYLKRVKTTNFSNDVHLELAKHFGYDNYVAILLGEKQPYM